MSPGAGPEPFQPLGELARWRVLVSEFATVERNTTVSYEQLGKLLDLDPDSGDSRKAIQAAVRQASNRLSKDYDRSLVAVRGVGYRVVLPEEHVELAQRHQKKSRGALVRAKTHVEHVDLSGLTEEGRKIVLATANALSWQIGQIRRLDIRQKDLVRAVEAVTTRQERSEEETAARFAALEAEIQKLKGKE